MEKIRWTFVRNWAMKTLMDYNEAILPLPVLDVVEKIPNLRIMTYLEMAQALYDQGYPIKARDVDWVQSNLADGSQDGALLRMSSDIQQCIILYNDDTSLLSPQRIRFTIAHEIGHFVLHHEFLTEISRKGISEGTYTAEEREADLFAQNLLMPMPTLKYFIDHDLAQKRFDVSSTAVSIAIEEYKRRPWAHPTFYPTTYKLSSLRLLIEPHPIKFHLGVFSRYFCPKCRHYSCSPNGRDTVRFCSICGNDNIKLFLNTNTFLFHEKEEQKVIQYKTFQLDSNGKAVVCPRCQNINFDSTAIICEVCGSYLINRCSGVDLDKFNNVKLQGDAYFGFDFIDNEYTSGCNAGEALSGRARFCPYCGATSTFYLQELLTDYLSEYQELSRQQSKELHLLDNSVSQIAEDGSPS